MVMAAFPQDVLEMMEQERGDIGVDQVSTAQVPDVILYHTIDHTSRPMFRHQANEALKKRFPRIYPDAPHMAGQPVFSRTPTGEVVQGKRFPCALNPKNPENASFSDWGFPQCLSEFVSPYHAQRHLEKKHRSEWETIKTVRDDLRRDEDRALQREMLAAVSGRSRQVEVKHNHGAPWNVKVAGCPKCEAE